MSDSELLLQVALVGTERPWTQTASRNRLTACIGMWEKFQTNGVAMTSILNKSMKPSLIAAGMLVSLCSPSWAVNKCTRADGTVAFQDVPCNGGRGEALTVRPANGDASPASSSASAPTPTDWKKKLAQIDARMAIQDAIERHVAVIGMTLAQLDLAMGVPNRINTGEYSSGSTQQRIYERGQTTWLVYTDDALVSAVQTTVTPGVNSKSKTCPSAMDIRSAETSASSITLSSAEKAERLRQIREMRNCGK
jgi:hypothetical protein